MDSFLMIGQSNMAGRGHLQEVPPIKNEALFMLRNGRWQPLCEPVNYDRPFAGIGLAPSFALEYATHFGCPTGLIPCAEGGSRLDEWSPDGQLFAHAVAQVQLARKISTVKGILWHQGENDSGEEQLATTYAVRLIETLQALRRETGLENVPIIAGELGPFLVDNVAQNTEHFRLINAALASEAVTQVLSPYGFVSADGLSANDDNLHFNAASLRIFGKRYFDVYCKVLAQVSNTL